jgi:hypothetical protein
VLAGRTVDFTPGAAAADVNRAGPRVDLDALQQREVDHDSVVAGPEPGAVVAATPNRQRQAAVTSERDRPRNVAGAGATRDQRRPLVDHGVVDLSRLLVVGVVGSDQSSLEVCELLTRGLCRSGGSAHDLPLDVFGRAYRPEGTDHMRDLHSAA